MDFVAWPPLSADKAVDPERHLSMVQLMWKTSRAYHKGVFSLWFHVLRVLPSLKSLLSVRMEILREFLDSSTIHGLSYISSSKVSPTYSRIYSIYHDDALLAQLHCRTSAWLCKDKISWWCQSIVLCPLHQGVSKNKKYLRIGSSLGMFCDYNI